MISFTALSIEALLAGGLAAFVLPKIFGGNSTKVAATATRTITNAEVVVAVKAVKAEHPHLADACDKCCKTLGA